MALSSSAFCATSRQMGLILLAALTLAGCLQTIQAARIVSIPPNPRVGQMVTLYVEDRQTPVSCYWFRGNSVENSQKILQVEFEGSFIRGNAHTGRESTRWGCALVIQGLRLSDFGEYTTVIMDLWGNPTKLVGRLQVSN